MFERAEHGHAVHLRTAQLRVVVEDADRTIAAFLRQFADQRLARAPGAEHEHALGRYAAREIEPAVFPISIGQARQAEEKDEHGRIDHEHRARHGGEAVVEKQRHRNAERAEHAGAQDVP